KSYYQFLFSYGFKITGDKEMTKDWIHEMFLELWNRHRQLPAVEHVGFYLKTYLKRKILRELPREQVAAARAADAGEHFVGQSYEELLVQLQNSRGVRQQVEKAMMQLSSHQLEMLRMRFFDEMSYEQIGDVTNTTPRTVYNHVYESLKTLRRHLAKISL
ncbi:MAG: sigma-70 family RNA polymerase sigma factor, partial [Bacteroidetes bacterium]|nr:sigma-70 family RNA polymerase sigma factor [Bacteroidota bacterium]